MSNWIFNDAATRLSKLLLSHLHISLDLSTDQILDNDPLAIPLTSARPGEPSHVRLSSRPNLSDSDFSALKELIQSFLNGLLEGHHEMNDLEQVSSHIESLVHRNNEDGSGQIVRLAHYRQPQHPFVWNEVKVRNEDHSIDYMRAWLLTGAAEAVHRRAIDIHADSGRYAFVGYSDINPEVWRLPSDARNLGGLSIFISEITTLTFDQQAELVAILSDHESDEENEPYFIFGTHLTPQELRHSHKVSEKLLALVKIRPGQSDRLSVNSSQSDHFLSP